MLSYRLCEYCPMPITSLALLKLLGVILPFFGASNVEKFRTTSAQSDPFIIVANFSWALISGRFTMLMHVVVCPCFAPVYSQGDARKVCSCNLISWWCLGQPVILHLIAFRDRFIEKDSLLAVLSRRDSCPSSCIRRSQPATFLFLSPTAVSKR